MSATTKSRMNSASNPDMTIASSFQLFHHLAQQSRVDPYHGRPEQHDQKGREYEQGEREDELDSGLRSGLLGQLAPLRPKRVRMHAQRARQARAQLVRLDEQGRQRLDVLDARPLAQVPERLCPGFARSYLAADDRELARQHVFRELFFLAYLYYRGVQAEPGLDADRQEVEHVRQRMEDVRLPFLQPVVQPQVRQQQPEYQAADAEHQGYPEVMADREVEYRNCQEQPETQYNLEADIDRKGAPAPKPRLDEHA